MSADSFESWLLAFLVRGAAIAIVWCVIGYFLRNLSASRVSAWWRGGILALLIAAILPPEVALLRIPLARSVPIPEPLPVVADSFAPFVVPPAPDKSTLPAPTETIAPAMRVSWIWIWLAGTAVLWVRLLLSHLRVTVLVRSAKPVRDPHVLAIIDEERGAGGQGRSVEIKVYEAIKTPFATGLFRPVIVVPESAVTGGDHLRMMIRHELAHLERADIAWQILAELAAILHWPNPFAWMMKQRLRLTQESAADDNVLLRGFDGPSYASLLFEAACRDSRFTRQATVVPMARVSTLRRRIGFLLDSSRSREVAGPFARLVVAGIACIAAVALGFGSLRAENENGKEESWSRRYRDTLRMEKSFADRFSGSSAAALAEFRKELAAQNVPLGESVKLELSADKKTLVVDFADADRRSMDGKFFPAISKEGWWRDAEMLRKKSIDRILVPLREKVEQSAREAAVIRTTRNIVDPDPENSSAVISSADGQLVEAEKRVRDKQARVAQVEERMQRLLKLQPTGIVEALRITEIEDITIQKMQAALQDAMAEAARLKDSGIGEKHPRRLAVEQQIAVFQETMKDALTSVKQNVAALLEIERRTLAKFEVEYDAAKKVQIDEKAHLLDYLKAKAQYLRNKKVYETAQIKYEIEDLERAHLEGVR